MRPAVITEMLSQAWMYWRVFQRRGLLNPSFLLSFLLLDKGSFYDKRSGDWCPMG